jgi:hypothetical protein
LRATVRYKMKVDIVSEIQVDSPALPHVTSPILIDALQNPGMRPLLQEVIVQARVQMLDGYVKFYLRARIGDPGDEAAVMELPVRELCDWFQLKIRAGQFLQEFYVNSVAALSPKIDGAW